ncbi:MAG: dTDP-4-dehydrorhamnose reductase [Segetibacter sp.]|jgi:dTDP-4-dehydrorhamnose reductase|nr:dTDP-4-dehydrorhamnose reductase [Segetibacter sp.]
MQNILITGKNGQLGNEIQVLASAYPDYNFLYTDIAELDITDKQLVSDFFNEHKPVICINAAAYTAVDKAETERELAFKVNAEAVKNLAQACKKCNAQFIHVSTDYVFNGLATSPYKEDDPTDPVNYYGYTKLKSEEFALAECPSSIIIRTSWVYSTFGNNFVKTMLRLMKEKESINVVNDQVGSPTYAADLAYELLHIATLQQGRKEGIYHYSNDAVISWFNFATAIKEISASSCNVNPIPTSAYPTPAKRPAYSVFDKTKIKQTFQVSIVDWKESLQHFFEKLKANVI